MNPLSDIAARYLQEGDRVNESLYDFIPRVSPDIDGDATVPPYHLGPIVDLIERAMRAARGEAEPVYACFSVPSQHGKTSTIQHALAKWIAQQPHDFLAYVSYNADQAQDKGKGIKDIAEKAGAKLRYSANRAHLWRTIQGGGLMSEGIHGSITGKSALRGIVIDDPFKDKTEYLSKAVRESVWNNFTTAIWTRLHRNTSVFVNHTRWGEDDLIGRIQSDPDMADLFEFINLPAIKPDGSALWPEVMPLDLLLKKKAPMSPADWNAIYMGNPLGDDGAVFEGVHYYDELPMFHRLGIGVDFAYTVRKYSDYSVAVVLAEYQGIFYIVDVVKKQCKATEFAGDLYELAQTYGPCPMKAYIGGTEKGIIDFMQGQGIPIASEQARHDKLVRSQSASQAWNKGNIRLPRNAPWETDFLSVVNSFTGMKGRKDDDVDALVSAFDVLCGYHSGGVFLKSDVARTKSNSTGLISRGRAGRTAW